MPRRVIFRDPSAGTREKGFEDEEPNKRVRPVEPEPAADETPPPKQPTRKGAYAGRRAKGTTK